MNSPENGTPSPFVNPAFPAELRLKEQIDLTRSILESSPDAIYITDPQYRIIDCNVTALSLFGLSVKEDVVGKSVGDLVSPESRALINRVADRVLAARPVLDELVQVTLSSGRRVTLEINSRSVPDEAGTVRFIVNVVRNVTERVKAEEALRESEQQRLHEQEALHRAAMSYVDASLEEDIYRLVSRQLKELSGGCIVVVSAYDPARDTLEVKAFGGEQDDERAAREILGREIRGVSFAVNAEARSALSSGKLVKVPGTMYVAGMGGIAPDVAGKLDRALRVKEIWAIGFVTRGRLLGDAVLFAPDGAKLNGGLIEAFISQAALAIQRKQIEEALVESEEIFRTLFNNANDAIFLHGLTEDNLPGRFMEANDVACRRLEYTREELLALSPFDIDVPEWTPRVPAIMERFMAQGWHTFETVHLSKSGRRIPVEISVRFFTLRGQRVVLSIARNITERKKAEEALRDSEEKYRSLVENINLRIALIDPANTILKVNGMLAREFGKEPGALVGKKCHRVFRGSEDVCDDCQVRKIFSEKRSVELERTEQGPDGASRTLSIRYFPVIGPDGEVTTFIHAVEDVTERKRAQEDRERLHAQLMQSEKMASIGTLASGIAHEFNNLLQVLSGNATLGLRARELGEAREALGVVAETSERAGKIVQNLLSFSRHEATDLETIDVKDIVESVLSLTEMLLKKQGIRVRYDHVKSPLRVWVNKAELQQVLFNLVINAREAMSPGGGTLRIRAFSKGGNAMIAVTDTGKGIRSEDRGRIFEPFFTTKGARGGSSTPGTGLGLYVSSNIVRKHGGTIMVESTEGAGSTFTIAVPLEKKRKRRAAGATAGGNSEKKLDIIVAVRDEATAKALEHHLAREGHRVRRDTDAPGSRRCDAVFLELPAEEKALVHALDNLRRVLPGVPIIMVSAASPNRYLVRELRRGGVRAFVQKPLSPVSIGQALDSLKSRS